MTAVADDLDEIDRKALESCMRLAASGDRERGEQLESMLAGSEISKPVPWIDVACFAASIVQRRSLGLRPWERAPCNASLDDLSDDQQKRKAQSVLRKMLKAGLSRYDPDPMRCLIDDHC